MDMKTYIEKGFELYCKMIPSDKYTQGIDIVFVHNHEQKIVVEIDKGDAPGVYILTNKSGYVLKIGQSANLKSRLHSQYKCIVNSTNVRIRNHIKEKEDIYVYILPLPYERKTVLGYNLRTSYAKDLEAKLLIDYKKKEGKLPILNIMIR
jgi:hypothetical protein